MLDPVKDAYDAARLYVAATGDPVHGPKFKAYQSFRDACTRAGLHHKAVLQEVRRKYPENVEKLVRATTFRSQ